MKVKSIIRIIFNLILGGMLVYGGIMKFDKPMPSPTAIVEKVQKGEAVAPNTEILKIKNYIFGMKQTGFFWEFLGIVELAAGILLISQVFSGVGALIALPVVLNIFLFHLFLEFEETGELLQTAGLLLINLVLIGFTYKTWKSLVYDKKILSLG
ncbi:MAG: DoxX protein [Flavobacterium sp. BFFFF1]|uniref:DoxX family membrane protein n=1 Tax=Flavobacterium sp. BFFFF1 TaxID=2015557 RepID=UPI000BD565DE|nr:DoxX family membrane protein [Flavobacterium sp. BFFFF1]OYU81546.1 MAG: DoxX protein [Flavobacterium sp. BFFFF1]